MNKLRIALFNLYRSISEELGSPLLIVMYIAVSYIFILAFGPWAVVTVTIMTGAIFAYGIHNDSKEK